jgi:hypothetical protein
MACIKNGKGVGEGGFTMGQGGAGKHIASASHKQKITHLFYFPISPSLSGVDVGK